MAWWHYDDGTPAPWGKGRFDPERLITLLLILAPTGLMMILVHLGKK